MNALIELRELFALGRRAQIVATQKREVPVPRATQLFIHGQGLVQVKDADTGRVLGFRRTVRDARTLAAQLERGEFCA